MPKVVKERFHQLGNKGYTTRTKWVEKRLYDVGVFEASPNLRVGVWCGSNFFEGVRPTFSQVEAIAIEILEKTGVLK